MDATKIPSAERLFQLLSTYQRMQLMLQSKQNYPVKIRLDQMAPGMTYIGTDDPEGIALFEELVSTRITQIQAAIEEL